MVEVIRHPWLAALSQDYQLPIQRSDDSKKPTFLSAQLLTEVGSCLPAVSESRHLPLDAREAFLGALVFLLSKWMTWFPEDFQAILTRLLKFDVICSQVNQSMNRMSLTCRTRP